MCYKLGRLSNGFNGRKDGTQTVHFMNHDEIKNIPTDRTVMYARIVVFYRSQKADPYQFRITVGGNLIDYPGEFTVGTANIVTSKIMWNSVLSTKDGKYMCANVSNFYLETPMKRREIKITGFGAHVFSILCGEDAVPHDLAYYYIRGMRSYFSGVIDEVASNHYSDSIGINFL